MIKTSDSSSTTEPPNNMIINKADQQAKAVCGCRTVADSPQENGPANGWIDRNTFEEEGMQMPCKTHRHTLS